MNRPPRITLIFRLLASAAGMVLLVATLLAAGQWLLRDTGDRIERTHDTHVHPLARLSEMQALVSRMRALEHELVNIRDLFALSEQVDALRRQREAFAVHLVALSAEMEPRRPEGLNALRHHWREYQAELERVGAAVLAQRFDEAREIVAFRSAAKVRIVHATLDQISAETEEDADRLVTEMLAEHQAAQRYFLIASSVGLLLIMGGQLLFARALRRRLDALRQAALDLTEGRHPEIRANGNDELSDLAAQFNAMQDKVIARERSLAESENRFRDLAESASDWFWETDGEHRLKYLSDRFFSMTGLPAESAIGRFLPELIGNGEAMPTPALDELRACLARQEPIRALELSIRGGGERVVPVSLSGKAVFDQRGVFEGFRGTGSDLGPRLMARAEALRAETLSAMATQIAGIAHEINTPLGICVTVASTLEDEHRAFSEQVVAGGIRRSEFEQWLDKNREGLQFLTGNLGRAASLVRGFKQVAVDLASDQRRRFDVAAYLDEVVLSLTPILKKSGHQVRIVCPPGVLVDSRPGALAQVITNLVANSVQHGFEGKTAGRIDIEVKIDADELLIAYRDNGHGVSEETARHLFEPFFTTKRGAGGSGLGLHIVRHLLVERLGGEISLDRTVASGVGFNIRLPLRPSAIAAAA